MNIFKKLLLLFAFIIILIVVKNSIFNVKVDQYAIVTQEGKIVSRKSNEPGLSLKIPFIQKVHYLPRAIVFEWNNDALLVQAHERRSILIDASILWTIEDPEKYYGFAGDKVNINNRISEMTIEKYRSLNRKNVSMGSDNKTFNKLNLLENGYIEKEIKVMLSKIGINAIDIKLKAGIDYQ